MKKLSKLIMAAVLSVTISMPQVAGAQSSQRVTQVVSFGDSYASNAIIPRGIGAENNVGSIVARQLGMSHSDYSVSTATARNGGLPVQLQQQIDTAIRTGGLGASTQIVTLSIGGNDLIGSPLANHDALQADLNRNLKIAADRIRAVAPQARIILTGYPSMLDQGACLTYFPGNIDITYGITNTPQLLNWARHNENTLNDRQRVSAQYAGVEFVDVKQATRGHGLCANSNPYVSRLLDTRPTGATMPLHVTHAGNYALANLTVNHIRNN